MVSIWVVWRLVSGGGEAGEEGDMPLPRYRPDGLDALCKATGFSRKELQLMYRSFKQVNPFLSTFFFYLIFLIPRTGKKKNIPAKYGNEVFERRRRRKKKGKLGKTR